MGRGGGGGHSGGRSFSSGGGRSFGGRSSSGSHRGGSSASGRGGSYHRSAPPLHYGGPRPVHVHNHYGGGYRRSPFSSIVTCVTVAVILIVFLSIIGGMLSSGGASGISKSTLERTAIQPVASFNKDCVDDRADWIMDRGKLLSGMESFYKVTGVQPALCITESLNGQDPEDYATARYDDLIGHESGVLLLFYEPSPSNWDAYYMAGRSAQTVMDSEACDILMDYVEAYYTSDMTEDEYFGAVFRETGDRIMSVTPTVASKIPVIVGGIVIITVVFGLIKIVKLRYKRARAEAEETERLLHTPVDRL